MRNPFLKRFREFILSPSHARTISALVILIIAAAVPLTVLVAQQQQQTQQHAASIGGQCTPGSATQCSGNQIVTCTLTSPPSGYYWEVSKVCSSGQTCSALATGGVSCQTLATPTPTPCDNTACVSSHVGSGTTPQCSGTTCEDYTWACRGTPAVCIFGPHGAAANASSCPNSCLPACTNGTTQCVNSGSYIQCVNGVWSSKYVCSTGTSCQTTNDTSNPCKNSTPICTPGNTQCWGSTGGTIQTCNSTGTAWTNGTVCSSSQRCMALATGGVSFQTQVCTPGNTQCSGSTGGASKPATLLVQHGQTELFAQAVKPVRHSQQEE